MKQAVSLAVCVALFGCEEAQREEQVGEVALSNSGLIVEDSVSKDCGADEIRHLGDCLPRAVVTSVRMHGLLRAANVDDSCSEGRRILKERSSITVDAWGTSFRVKCSEGDLVLCTAGPDQRFDTTDDFCENVGEVRKVRR